MFAEMVEDGLGGAIPYGGRVEYCPTHAAATDLLAALEDVVPWLENYYTEAPPQFEADVDKARAAIARAKGDA